MLKILCENPHAWTQVQVLAGVGADPGVGVGLQKKPLGRPVVFPIGYGVEKPDMRVMWLCVMNPRCYRYYEISYCYGHVITFTKLMFAMTPILCLLMLYRYTK
jgi:hypothetical protein